MTPHCPSPNAPQAGERAGRRARLYILRLDERRTQSQSRYSRGAATGGHALLIPLLVWTGENNFGTVENAYDNASVPHVPKLSYTAASVLQEHFADLELTSRIPASNGSVDVDNGTYALSFGQGKAVAVWKARGRWQDVSGS